MNEAAALPVDVTVLERGWLSSNSVLLQGDERGALLVDTGYCTHSAQTLDLVKAAIAPGNSLRMILNSHLHSDHCGGNARIAADFNCPIWVPPGQFQAATDWNQDLLSFASTGQHCDRFLPSAAVIPGEFIEHGGRQWQALAAPGHDPHSLIFFEAELGILISADALWEHGFGIVFPEVEGASGFDEVARTLDLIAGLDIRWVIPGHGKVFSDVDVALDEACKRLDFFQRNPQRHARYAAKALTKFHLLELISQPLPDLLDWLTQTPIQRQMWEQFFKPEPIRQWSIAMLDELEKSRAIRIQDGVVYNT
jgi:glyoxylase-like metal-dependent hydrolase (beta-lactamase superfamily II)